MVPTNSTPQLAIPWKEIGVTAPKAGHKFGLLVSRDRRAGTNGTSSYLVDCGDEAKDTAWKPTFVLK